MSRGNVYRNSFNNSPHHILWIYVKIPFLRMYFKALFFYKSFLPSSDCPCGAWELMSICNKTRLSAVAFCRREREKEPPSFIASSGRGNKARLITWVKPIPAAINSFNTATADSTPLTNVWSLWPCVYEPLLAINWLHFIAVPSETSPRW